MPALNAALIQQSFAAQRNPSDCVFQVFDELPSTNKHLMQQCQNNEAPELSLCVTAKQTAGVGRRGKEWLSGPDCITFSLLQQLPCPASEIGGLSLVTGLAIADILDPLCEPALQLKWPNDILASWQKLCGILIELPSMDEAGVRVVTGIGINFAPNETHQQLDRPYTTLQDLVIDRDKLPAREVLIGQIAAAVATAHEQFAEQGWAPFRDAFEHRDCLTSQVVQIEQGPRKVSGTAHGVDANGALLVDIDGEITPYAAGEVSVRRPENS